MQIYLAASPSALQEASGYCRGLAHAAYRIGPNSTLLRQSLLLQTRGGLLSVSDREAPFIDDPEALCAAVLRECGYTEEKIARLKGQKVIGMAGDPDVHHRSWDSKFGKGT